MSTLPKLVPNSLYSFSNLHISSNAPFSAPPVENSNKKQETDRIFFGESFNETQPYFSNNNSPIGSVSDFSNLMNLRSFPPLSSELPPPLSAPPFHSCTNGGGFAGIRGGGSAGCSSGNSGMVQGGGTGTRFRFTNRPTSQPVYFSLKVFLGGIQASLTTSLFFFVLFINMGTLGD
ncbi:unnamed protein product [Meloidogyne enterolobii]|uniref:Uncharacterized protein n=1 Tax=Meloidogyne enterolobii TaxID=390850 RepID=A0ACB1A0V0_MELEN